MHLVWWRIAAVADRGQRKACNGPVIETMKNIEIFLGIADRNFHRRIDTLDTMLEFVRIPINDNFALLKI